jgi:hypothetical protein
MYIKKHELPFGRSSRRGGNSDLIGELQYRPSLSGYFALIFVQPLRASKYLSASAFIAVVLVFQLAFPVLVFQYFSMWLAVACLGTFSASLFYIQRLLPGGPCLLPLAGGGPLRSVPAMRNA